MSIVIVDSNKESIPFSRILLFQNKKLVIQENVGINDNIEFNIIDTGKYDVTIIPNLLYSDTFVFNDVPIYTDSVTFLYLIVNEMYPAKNMAKSYYQNYKPMSSYLPRIKSNLHHELTNISCDDRQSAKKLKKHLMNFLFCQQ